MTHTQKTSDPHPHCLTSTNRLKRQRFQLKIQNQYVNIDGAKTTLMVTFNSPFFSRSSDSSCHSRSSSTMNSTETWPWVILIAIFSYTIHASPLDAQPGSNVTVADASADAWAKLSALNPFANMSDSVISTMFPMRLYTRGKYAQKPFIMALGNQSNFNASTYNVKNACKVIIYGYECNYRTVSGIKDAYLYKEDVNVIIMDWDLVALQPLYYTQEPQVIGVGTVLARFIVYLIHMGANIKQFHIMGHSLGAHVVGIAGRAVNVMLHTQIPRCTALDASKPGYGLPFTRAIQFAKDCCARTDAIHVDPFKLGLLEPIADADFYVNKPTFVQPGCLLKEARDCSHFRAVLIMIETIMNPNGFEARKCIDPLFVFCNELETSSIPIGDAVPTDANGIYYVPTRSTFPCAPHGDRDAVNALNLEEPSIALFYLVLPGLVGPPE